LAQQNARFAPASGDRFDGGKAFLTTIADAVATIIDALGSERKGLYQRGYPEKD